MDQKKWASGLNEAEEGKRVGVRRRTILIMRYTTLGTYIESALAERPLGEKGEEVSQNIRKIL